MSIQNELNYKLTEYIRHNPVVLNALPRMFDLPGEKIGVADTLVQVEDDGQSALIFINDEPMTAVVYNGDEWECHVLGACSIDTVEDVPLALEFHVKNIGLICDLLGIIDPVARAIRDYKFKDKHPEPSENYAEIANQMYDSLMTIKDVRNPRQARLQALETLSELLQQCLDDP